jgi:hypothetical protein
MQDEIIDFSNMNTRGDALANMLGKFFVALAIKSGGSLVISQEDLDASAGKAFIIDQDCSNLSFKFTVMDDPKKY